MQNKNKTSKINSLLYSMFILQQSADNLLLSEVGLGLSAYRILTTLDDKRSCSQRSVAVGLHQTEANISRQIRVMADQGLVKIAPNKKDKRQRDLTMTSKGSRLFTQAQKLLIKHQETLVKSSKL